MHSLKKEGHRDLYFNQAEGRAIKKKEYFYPTPTHSQNDHQKMTSREVVAS